MKKTFLSLVLALPVAALPFAAVAKGPDPGGQPSSKERAQHMQKRARLALTLGLAEALDLDAAQALKFRDTIAKFDDRRAAAQKQLADAGEVLRRAAQGEKVSAAEVDQAIAKGFEARAQVEAINKETVAAIGKDLTPERRARAVLFLARFERRMGHHMGMGHGMGPGMHDRGMGPGGMRGGPGPGMMGGGPGMMMGMGPGGACPDCPWVDEGGGDGEDVE